MSKAAVDDFDMFVIDLPHHIISVVSPSFWQSPMSLLQRYHNVKYSCTKNMPITPWLTVTWQYQLCKYTDRACSGPTSGHAASANHSSALHCLTLLRPIGGLLQSWTRNSGKQQTVVRFNLLLSKIRSSSTFFRKGTQQCLCPLFQSQVLLNPLPVTFYFVDFLVLLLHEKLSA